MNIKNDKIKCSSCGCTNSSHPQRDFIKDSDGIILCESCINYFYLAKKHIDLNRVSNQNEASSFEVLENPPSPKEIYDFLSSKVIAQDEAKQSLSIAVSHHYKRLKDPSINKSNVLLIGPTGTGKTEMGRSLSEFLKVPFVSADATSFTSKGYVGEDVDSIILRLLASCNWDVEKAKNGIIFIDEIDKVARRGTGDHQVGTVAVQQELLRLIEGSEVKLNIPNPASPTGHDSIYLDTSNILFICAGAFVGLEDIVNKQNSRPLGIAGLHQKLNSNEWTNFLEAKHLIQYGIIPEFLGRLPVIVTTNKLNKTELLMILKDVDNSIIQQYKKLFQLDNISAKFSDSFLEEIVELSIQKDLGARGLRQILESKMKNIFFNIDLYRDKSIIIDNNSVLVEE